MSRGKFIVVEGADGAGTTTQAHQIADKIQKLGQDVYVTAEPTNGPTGRLIRKILKGEEKMLDWLGMVYMFMADRMYHLTTRIVPTLEQGHHVVCDRYYPSTLVYQSLSARENDMDEQIMERMRFLFKMMDGEFLPIFDRRYNYPLVEPDLILFLDVSAREAHHRLLGRDVPKEIYEQTEFQRKVVRTYRQWFNTRMERGENSRSIPGYLPVDEVTAECWKHIVQFTEFRNDNEEEGKTE